MKKYFVITIALLLTLTHMHVLPMENDDIKLFEKFKTLTIQKFSQQKSALHNRYKNKNIVDPRKLRDGIIEIETLIVTAPTKNLYSEEIRGLQKIQTQLRNKLDKLLGPLNSAQKLLFGLLSVTENDKPVSEERAKLLNREQFRQFQLIERKISENYKRKTELKTNLQKLIAQKKTNYRLIESLQQKLKIAEKEKITLGEAVTTKQNDERAILAINNLLAYKKLMTRNKMKKQNLLFESMKNDKNLEIRKLENERDALIVEKTRNKKQKTLDKRNIEFTNTENAFFQSNKDLDTSKGIIDWQKIGIWKAGFGYKRDDTDSESSEEDA